MTTIPFTIDGTAIDPAAPRSVMTDQQAQDIADAAEAYRQAILHVHYDLLDRTVTAYAANVPGETVAFSFGDGSFDVVEPVDVNQGASTEHTYLADGVYALSVYTPTDRWSLEVPINWPLPASPPDPPEEP